MNDAVTSPAMFRSCRLSSGCSHGTAACTVSKLSRSNNISHLSGFPRKTGVDGKKPAIGMRRLLART